jgi:hypothetical protein
MSPLYPVFTHFVREMKARDRVSATPQRIANRRYVVVKELTLKAAVLNFGPYPCNVTL